MDASCARVLLRSGRWFERHPGAERSADEARRG